MKILITGSGSGIGNSLARSLAAEGAEIWGIGRSPQTRFQNDCDTAGLCFRHSQVDVSDWPQVAALRQEVGSDWPYLDALICCAGVQSPIGPAMSLDPHAWSASVRVNLDGTFFVIRAFHDLLLRAASRAKVVCFSGGGAATPRPQFAAYAVAKTGVVRLVETLAEEWKDLPIDINAVAPGAINTRMTAEVLAAGPQLAGKKEYAQALEQQQSGGAPVAKVVGLVRFLLSRESDGINGKLISAPWDPWDRLGNFKERLRQSDIYSLRRITPKDRGETWT